jgi:hypothetical protein
MPTDLPARLGEVERRLDELEARSPAAPKTQPAREAEGLTVTELRQIPTLPGDDALDRAFDQAIEAAGQYPEWVLEIPSGFRLAMASGVAYRFRNSDALP